MVVKYGNRHLYAVAAGSAEMHIYEVSRFQMALVNRAR